MTLQTMVGKLKRSMVADYMTKPDNGWNSASDELRIKAMEKINNRAGSIARKQVMIMIMEGIESGEVEVNMVTERYKWLNDKGFEDAKEKGSSFSNKVINNL